MRVYQSYKRKTKISKITTVVRNGRFARVIMISHKREHTPGYHGQEFTPWDISKLDSFFNSHQLPATILLNDYSFCSNVQKMVIGHLAIIRAHNGNSIYKPYLDRLINLAALIEDHVEKSRNDIQQKLLI